MAEHENRYHILLSDCTALTEFNEHPFSLTLDRKMEGHEFNQFLSENAQHISLIPKKIMPYAFVTFDTHVHRRTVSERYELRFFFRVAETNHLSIFPREEAHSRLRIEPNETGGWGQLVGLSLTDS